MLKKQATLLKMIFGSLFKNKAVKKFHEVAHLLGTRPCAPRRSIASALCSIASEKFNHLRVRGLVPMHFELVFCSPPPFSAKRSKSSVKTKSVQVSPPPEHRTTTPCTFTEWQKAFVGPHQMSKILGQKPPINH